MAVLVAAAMPKHALPPLEAQVAPAPPLRLAPPLPSATKLEVISIVKRLTCCVCNALREPPSYQMCSETEYCLFCVAYRYYSSSSSTCTSTCYSCSPGTWQPDPPQTCFTTCTGGCCASCNSLYFEALGDQSIAVVSSSAVAGATAFSQSCLCAAGYYFVSANDKWGIGNTTGTGPNKDYLLPCQPCSSGTYKNGTNLLGPSACIPCSSGQSYANSKSSPDEFSTGKSFQASSSIVQVQAFSKTTVVLVHFAILLPNNHSCQ